MLDEMFTFEACIYNFLIVEGFGAFLLIGRTIMLGRRGGALEMVGIVETAGVDANRNDFSFRILAIGFNEPRIVFSLNKGVKLVLTYFLIVSAFSLSNKKTSYFEIEIVSKSSQRLLTTGIKSLLGFFLLSG